MDQCQGHTSVTRYTLLEKVCLRVKGNLVIMKVWEYLDIVTNNIRLYFGGDAVPGARILYIYTLELRCPTHEHASH